MYYAAELVRLVRLVGGHGREGGLVFVCYLDDSDNRETDVITLAGYVARLEAWEAYERHANAVYDRRGVGDEIHAIQFNGNKPPFKGWRVGQKLSLLDDLFFGNRFTWGISVSVSKSGFARAKPDKAIGPNMSAMGLAFAVILHILMRGNPLASLIQTEGLSFVIESGHNNNEELGVYFNKFKDHELLLGALRSITFAGKKEAKALHLADLLAFFSRRHHARVLAHGAHLIIPPDRYLKKLLSKLPHVMKLIDLDDTGAIQVATEQQEGDVPWVAVPIDYLASRPERPS